MTTIALTETVYRFKFSNDIVLPWEQFKEAAMQNDLLTSDSVLEEEVVCLQSAVCSLSCITFMLIRKIIIIRININMLNMIYVMMIYVMLIYVMLIYVMIIYFIFHEVMSFDCVGLSGYCYLRIRF